MEENKEELSSQDVIDSDEPEASSSSSADPSEGSSAGDSSEADAGNSEESEPDKEEQSTVETSTTVEESTEDESETTETETTEDATTEENTSEETTTEESTDGLLVSPDGRVMYSGDSGGYYPLYDSYEEFMASPLYVTRYENEVLNRLEFIQYALALLIALIFLLIFRRK